MIHQYKNNGYNIVMDVNSGSVHIVDDVVYDVIPLAEQLVSGGIRDVDTVTAAVEACQKLTYSHDEVREAVEEILELAQDNVLFTEDIYEKYIGNFKQRQTVVKALCLHIAHDCNLACQYCFAEEGEYHGRRALMSFEVGKKALDFLVANSGSRVNLEVDFFGGEPLMNWHVVKQTVAYCREQEKKHNKLFKLSLTTNGMLLDKEKVKYLTDNHISLILSLDGRKEMHDAMRPGVHGEGTYDQILKNLQYCVAHRNGEEYYVRGTFTRRNMDTFTDDVLDMIDKGFPAVSMEPVVGNEDEPYAIREEDLPAVKKEYERLANTFIQREAEGKPFFFYHFNMNLWKGPCLPKRLRGCGAGHEYLAVVPNGDIYPCHQFVGRDGYVIGNVYEGLKNMKMMKEFRDNHVLSKPECVDCWAKFFCSGGCHANNESYAGDMHKPYHLTCEIQKKRIECAMMIQAYNKMNKPKVMKQPGLEKMRY